MRNYKEIKLIILDVDGTLTDGGIYYSSNGEEIKRFDVKDGLAIKIALAAGIDIALLTGRCSSMVERRAHELQIPYLISGVQIKIDALEKLLKETGIRYEEVFYIGDDWNDLQCMEKVGLRGCPADADEHIKKICEIISESAGGHGAVRECIKIFLEKRSEWELYARKEYYQFGGF